MESPPSKPSSSQWWAIGKSLALAGAAIVSAPVIVPPLLILSGVGFSLSIPFGIYFAGLACTDKLMSSLFPSPRGNEIKADVDDREEAEEVVVVVEEEEWSTADKKKGGEEEEEVGGLLPKVEREAAEEEKERLVEAPIEEAKSTAEKKGKGKMKKKK